MNTYNDEINIKTNEEIELVDITSEVQNVVERSNISDGIVLVYTRHTTAAIIINEAEGKLMDDIVNSLNKWVPISAGYKHGGNAHSHIKASFIGPSETIPLIKGNLKLGTWQSVFFAEFDGPRSRSVTVQVLG
jgi:secondary thiamine-phosphate synthase enzyme